MPPDWASARCSHNSIVSFILRSIPCARLPCSSEAGRQKGVRAAITAGKDVYCEWPLTPTAAKSAELATLADAAGVKTQIGLQRPLAPAFRYVHDLVAQGSRASLAVSSIASGARRSCRSRLGRSGAQQSYTYSSQPSVRRRFLLWAYALSEETRRWRPQSRLAPTGMAHVDSRCTPCLSHYLAHF